MAMQDPLKRQLQGHDKAQDQCMQDIVSSHGLNDLDELQCIINKLGSPPSYCKTILVRCPKVLLYVKAEVTW